MRTSAVKNVAETQATALVRSGPSTMLPVESGLALLIMVKNIMVKIWLNLCSPTRLLKNIRALASIFGVNILGILVTTYLTVPLVVKYRGMKVPFRQLVMLDTALKFTRLLDQKNIDYVLITGSLLGAIRQGAFAGRPRDFDLAIRSQDRQKLLDLIPEFRDQGLCVYECTGRRDSANGFIVGFPIMLCFQEKWAEIDIHSYIAYENGWRWNRWDQDIPKISFVIDFPERGNEKYAEIFSYKFKIPANSHDYLEAVYGKDWRIPDSRQFAWFPQENRHDI